ncbi:MAG: hypothetical protein ACYS26_09710 [Planctomycetota bacterium]|jgi:hypothetical protein
MYRSHSILAAFALCGGFAEAQVINEIRVDQPGFDTEEYFELAGPPGLRLDGLSYVVLGDSSAGGSGVVEAVVNLDGSSIPESGYFVAAESGFTLGAADLVTNLAFENADTVSHFLVRDFSAVLGEDLDLDDDGLLDAQPWSQVIDSIALVEPPSATAGTEHAYGTLRAGPEGLFAPGHVYRESDGQGGLIHLAIGQIEPLLGTDTPGAPNADFGVLPASFGGSVGLQVDLGGGGFAGKNYLILCSASGVAPGLALGGGVTLPLNPDELLRLSVNAAGGPFFPNTIGGVDTGGKSLLAQLVLPAAPAMVGIKIHAAAVVFDAVGVIEVSTEPIEVLLD